MMKRFTVSCKDEKTGMEMILSECSYNNACSFLEGQNLGKLIGCETVSITMTKIAYEKRTFFYDEDRGYLLGE